MGYLDGMPKAARHLAAARSSAEHWRAIFEWATTGLILLLILKSRLLVRLRDRLQAMVSKGWLVSILCAFRFVFVLEGLGSAAAGVATLLWPQAGGETTTAALSALPYRVVFGGLGLALFQGIAGRAPKWWWAGLSGIAALVAFCLVLIPSVTLIPQARGDAPVANFAAPALLSFVRSGGLNAKQLYVFDDADPRAVDMEGLGPIAHAAVSRAALTAPDPETYAAIGHLLGHYRHKDLWSMALLYSVLATGFFFAVSRCYAPLARRLGDGGGGSLADPAALPTIGLLAWVFTLAAVPAFNLFDQAINYRADDYAMSLTRDPDALCRWLVATEGRDKANPSPIEAVLFYDHPPLAWRLENAMRWRAAHTQRP